MLTTWKIEDSAMFYLYHVTGFEEFTLLEPVTLQYKRLKNGEFASLTLRIMNQKDNRITDDRSSPC